MIKYHALRGPRRRRHQRLLRHVRAAGEIYVCAEHTFRMIERLHRAGLVTACVSKRNLFGPFTGRPFRELAVFPTEAAALERYSRILSRR